MDTKSEDQRERPKWDMQKQNQNQNQNGLHTPVPQKWKKGISIQTPETAATAQTCPSTGKYRPPMQSGRLIKKLFLETEDCIEEPRTPKKSLQSKSVNNRSSQQQICPTLHRIPTPHKQTCPSAKKSYLAMKKEMRRKEAAQWMSDSTDASLVRKLEF